MPETTRELILDAAASLLQESQTLTLTGVARRARISRGTLYRYFSDISALRQALTSSGRLHADRRLDIEGRLLDAVGALLRSHGLGATTLEKVARHIGVSPVTVYRHFGDRRALLRAYVIARTPRRLALTLPSARLELDLLTLAREALAFLAEDRALFNLAISTDPEAVELMADLRRNSRSFREITTQVLEGRVSGDSREAAQAFLGIILAFGWELKPSADVDPLARRAVSLFLNGVLG